MDKPKSVGEIMSEKDTSSLKSTMPTKDNVNNVVRNNDNVDNAIKNNNYVTNVNVDHLTTEELLSLLEKRFTDDNDKSDWLANELATSLADADNLNYYRSVVGKYPSELLLECLSITKAAMRDGIIRTTPAKYYVGVVKRKVSKLK